MTGKNNKPYLPVEVLIFCVSLSQATQLQTRYMELLTMSADYYRFLGDLLKNMEELKVPLRCSPKKKTSLMYG